METRGDTLGLMGMGHLGNQKSALQLIFLQHAETLKLLGKISGKLDKILMNQSDEAVQLQAVADDLVKVKAGIDALKQSVADLTAQLANIQTTPAVDTALANVQANLAQVDSDLPAPPVPPQGG